MRNKTVAIHQPNFFPWLGLFHRISLVDTFVFFDHVQAPLGKSWLSRNKILCNGETKWLTMSINKSGKSFQKISEVQINYKTNLIKKHLGTIRQFYLKSNYFDDFFPVLLELYNKNHQYISDFNKEFIKIICDLLKLDVKFVSSSNLIESGLDNSLKGNDLVLEICKLIEAKEYISGTGCLDFIEPVSFRVNDIKFSFQEFSHPNYEQMSEKFASHLSIIDVIFNIGIIKTKELLGLELTNGE